MVSDLGLYEHVAKKGAVCAEGMSEIKGLLRDFILIQPCAELKHGQLKAGCMHLAKLHPKTPQGPKVPTRVWASLRAERVTTILHHLRRVTRSGASLTQLMHKMCADQFADFDQQVIKQVQLLSTSENSPVSKVASPITVSATAASDSAVDALKPLRKPLVSATAACDSADAKKSAPKSRFSCAKKRPASNSDIDTGAKDDTAKGNTAKDNADTVAKFKIRRQTKGQAYAVHSLPSENVKGRQLVNVAKKGVDPDVLHHLAKKARKSLELGTSVDAVKMAIQIKLSNLKV